MPVLPKPCKPVSASGDTLQHEILEQSLACVDVSQHKVELQQVLFCPSPLTELEPGPFQNLVANNSWMFLHLLSRTAAVYGLITQHTAYRKSTPACSIPMFSISVSGHKFA